MVGSVAPFGAASRCGSRRKRPFAALGVAALLVVACSGSGAQPSPTPPATASTPPSASPHASPSPSPGGPATLDAPAQVTGGESFEVAWTGPQGPSDYVTIVAAGAVAWTNEPYFGATGPSPGRLTAPTTPGDYELWYVSNADGAILARRPIVVTAFEGALSGPESVVAGSSFEVGWSGPDGPGDYVTIVKAGAERWTNESYFNTSGGSPGALVAPLEPGPYELWYVTGADAAVMARATIAVTPLTVTLDAPDSVARGATFEVSWTGPDGPGDYLTIVPAGSPDGTYLSYAYTASGSPATITAPDEAGSYEVRYASDRVAGTFASIPIKVE